MSETKYLLFTPLHWFLVLQLVCALHFFSLLDLDNDMMAFDLESQEGFLAVVNMVPGAAAVAQAVVGAAPDVVDLVEGEVAPAAGQVGPMRWNNNTSWFVLRKMAQIVSEGSKTDKTYKDKDVTAVARLVSEFSGVPISATQVYNHLRKWKQKWSKIARLKDLSGASFDEDACAIMLEQDHYLGHCKVPSPV
jgi:hypothetical protein